MANITEILGTDSISSSRLTLNSNFTAINDEVADITNLIDPVTSTITGVDSISAESINLSTLSGGSSLNIASIDSTGATFSVTTDFGGDVTFQKKVLKTGKLGSPSSGSVASSPTAIDVSTIFTAASAPLNLPVGTDGQEITIINTLSSAVGINTTNIAANTISLDNQNSSITLRFMSTNSTWYIIGLYATTVTSGSIGLGLGGTPALGI